LMRTGRFLLSAAVIALTTLVISPVSFSDVTETVYYRDSSGKIKSHRVTVLETDEVNVDIKMDCSRGFAKCNACGMCHTQSDRKAAPQYFDGPSVQRHFSKYFKDAEYSLSSGQKLSWDDGESYYVNERNQLVKYSKYSAKLLASPTGSKIVKGRSGRPAFILFNCSPTVFDPTLKK